MPWRLGQCPRPVNTFLALSFPADNTAHASRGSRWGAAARRLLDKQRPGARRHLLDQARGRAEVSSCGSAWANSASAAASVVSFTRHFIDVTPKIVRLGRLHAGTRGPREEAP